MNTCPNCSHKELVGVVFCSECGAQLIFGDNRDTLKVRITTGFNTVRGTVAHPGYAPPVTPPYTDAPVILYLIDCNTYLEVKGAKEVIMGRVSEGQSMIPDIDLNPFQAFESGVSRIHAAIRVNEDAVLITDLGSVNGIRINGVKIEANIPQLVRDGDQVSLGKLKLLVIIPNQQERSPTSGG